LTDEALVIRDLLNALSIKQGEKPGMPSYGTTIWNNLFEPNDSTTTDAIEDEIRRIAAEDSRISLNTVAVWPQDNGVLVEVEIMVIKFNQPMTLGISLDLADGYAKLMPGG
jgi:phage baseplate assembly protein W